LQLLKILDKWTELLENGGRIDVIYTDVEKAFDKIPHKRLISKLSSYGLNKDIISWIEAFLNNRKQRVCIKGPILFIIYINDLVKHINYGSDLYLYATYIFICK